MSPTTQKHHYTDYGHTHEEGIITRKEGGGGGAINKNKLLAVCMPYLFGFYGLKFSPVITNIFKLFRRIKYKMLIKLSPEPLDYFTRQIY